jgi:hypothetical protein
MVNKIKTSRPLRMPPYKLPASLPTPLDSFHPQIIPNDPYDWKGRPVLASKRDKYPVYWTPDSIAFNKSPLPQFNYVVANQRWAVSKRPLHFPPRYLLLAGAIGLQEDWFSDVMAAIGTSYLEAKHVNVTYYNRHKGNYEFTTQGYLDVGVPVHEWTTTTDGVFEDIPLGVTDPDQTHGGETLVITGTENGSGTHWYQVVGTSATDLVHLRQQLADNWQVFYDKSVRFRHVHFFPDSGIWSTYQHNTNDHSVSYGTALGALAQTVDLVNNPDFFFHIVSPTLSILTFRYPAALVAAAVQNFFGPP